MRWYTGTPRNFDGNAGYFARESGLTCRGFQKLGHDSRAIMLGPRKEDDLPDIVRASNEELCSPMWWASLGLDGMVFYTWGSPLYAGMVAAARTAGVRIAQVTDTQGIFSPLSDWKAHLLAERAHYWYEPRVKQLARTLLKIPVSHSLRIFTRDLPMAKAIAESDVFLASTPKAALRFRKFVTTLVGEEAGSRVHFMPVPVNFHFHFGESDEKQNEVMAVGRWDSLQKRTPLLMAAITRALDKCSATFRIFGKATPELVVWQAALPSGKRERVILEGIVSNALVAEAYRRAKVMLVSSAYEGCHNSSAEAVCSGASVVGCRSPFLGAIEWHTSKSSGSLADREDADSLCATLCAELQAWDQGNRDPVGISRNWRSEFRPDLVAGGILNLFGGPLL